MTREIINNLYSDLNLWANGVYNLQEISMRIMDKAIELAVSIGVDPDTAPPEDVQ